MGNPLSTAANELNRRVLNMALPQGSPIEYGDIGTINYSAISNYNAFQLEVRARTYHGLTIQGNYTWSHTLDEENPFYIQLTAGLQNPNCLACDYGNSDIDYRHRLVLSYTYHTPSLTRALKVNNAVARKVFDDWGLSGISSFSTGDYATIMSGNTDNSLTGIGHDRAELVGNWRLPSGRSNADRAAEYFNTQAFTNNPVGQYGNTGRNFIPEPGTWGTDLSILKHLPLWSEHREVELRFEFYDAFNHENFLGPGTTVGSPGFGVANLGAQPGRIIQLAGKFMF
jgi:hypothetical protein